MGRGQKFSRHELSFGETMGLEKPEARSLKKANKYSKHFHESETKNLSKRQQKILIPKKKKQSINFVKVLRKPSIQSSIPLVTLPLNESITGD